MMDKRIVIIIIGVLLFDGAVVLVGNTLEEVDDEGELRVAVTIPPQEQFVEKVGGDMVGESLLWSLPEKIPIHMNLHLVR